MTAITTSQAAAIIDGAFRNLLPGRFDSPLARALMLAIGKAESDYRHTIQMVGSPPRPTGPARGYWQFERRGGVVGVMAHDSSARYARAVCAIRELTFDSAAIHAALATDNELAAAFARLLLWTDPRALPAIGDAEGAFAYYNRNWRPGAFHRDPVGVRGRFIRGYREVVG